MSTDDAPKKANKVAAGERMWFGTHEVSGVVVWIAVVGLGSLATTDCIHCSGDLRSCGRVVKLVDLATSGG